MFVALKFEPPPEATFHTLNWVCLQTALKGRYEKYRWDLFQRQHGHGSRREISPFVGTTWWSTMRGEEGWECPNVEGNFACQLPDGLKEFVLAKPSKVSRPRPPARSSAVGGN